MEVSYELMRRLEASRAQHRVTLRVPSSTRFAKLSLYEQIAMIGDVQRELDFISNGLRNGSISPNHRGRGAALRNVRKRQQRLEKLAHDFGFRREWRKYVRAKAIAGTESIAV